MSPPTQRGALPQAPLAEASRHQATSSTDEGTPEVRQELLPFAAGEALKAEGMAVAAANTDDGWRDRCDAGIAELARRGEPFQAADLADHGVPEPDHPNRWGPRLLAASKAGLIEAVGYAPSKRPSTACSAVRVWRGTAAVQQEAS